MSIISIRQVRPEDVTSLAAVRAASLIGNGAVDEVKLLEKFRLEVEVRSGSGNWNMFVAEVNNSVVGYGRCEFYDNAHDQSLYETVMLLPTGWYLRGGSRSRRSPP